jgi:hypothetical protein
MRSPIPPLRIVSQLALGSLLISCGGSDGGPSGPGPADPTPANIIVSPSDVTLDAIGAEVQFTATVLDQLNRVMPNASVAWSSSDVNVASITPNGRATAVANGSATIIASSSSSAFGWGTVMVDARPLAIKTGSLIPGVLGFAYSQMLEGEGAASPVWSVTQGGLPAGLALDPGSGIISGTPTTVGVATFTVALSSAGQVVTREFSLLIVSGDFGLTLDDDQFAAIPAGTFQMGSADGSQNERPVHTVNITKAFLIQKTEVTQAQWEAVTGTNPTAFPTCGQTCPMDGRSWNEVQAFIQALNLLDPGKNYRLPTEAEWEYAARAGTTGAYGGTGVLDDMGWYLSNAGGRPRPVAQKEPNDWGLYDMHGNAREWVQDYYSATYYSVSPEDDPPGPEAGTYRVTRGGASDSQAVVTRSAARAYGWPDRSTSLASLRLVRDG